VHFDIAISLQFVAGEAADKQNEAAQAISVTFSAFSFIKLPLSYPL
jgi:hypothetical protein